MDGKKIKEISTGCYDFSFVLTENNEIYSCGSNSFGCLALDLEENLKNKVFTKV